MPASLALLALLVDAYVQSGVPGLGLLELMYSVIKQKVISSMKLRVNPERDSGIGTIDDGTGPGNSDTPSLPVSVENRDVDSAETRIEVNYHFYGGTREPEPTLPVSDGGERQEESVDGETRED